MTRVAQIQPIATCRHPQRLGYIHHSQILQCSVFGVQCSVFNSFITDADGEGYQHLQYMPFGETSVSQKISWWSTPYQFTGKEKDDETGFSYFGARYYNSDLSIWLSVDPLAHKYPSMSAYMYCAGNPVMLVDPDGRWIKGAGVLKNIFWSDERIEANQAAQNIPGANVTRIPGRKGWRVWWVFNHTLTDAESKKHNPEGAPVLKGYGFMEYRRDRTPRKFGDFLKDSQRMHAINDIAKYGCFHGIRDLRNPMINPTTATHANVMTEVGKAGFNQPYSDMFRAVGGVLLLDQGPFVILDIYDHGLTKENAFDGATMAIGSTGRVGAMAASTAVSYKSAGDYFVRLKAEMDSWFDNLQNWGYIYGIK